SFVSFDLLLFHDTLSPFPPRRSSDLRQLAVAGQRAAGARQGFHGDGKAGVAGVLDAPGTVVQGLRLNRQLAGGGNASIVAVVQQDRKSTRLNSSHVKNSYAVFRLKKK